MITYEDFAKVEIRVGEIISVERVPETDKLLRLMVHFGEEAPRQIVSGIAHYFTDPSILVGKRTMFVTNLEPRTIRGLESHGMLFALSTPDGEFSLLEPWNSVPTGTRAK